MGKEVHYVLKRGTKITDEQIAMIEAARNLPEEYDKDLPETDPVSTPAHYAALMQAVAERNRRIVNRRKEMA